MTIFWDVSFFARRPEEDLAEADTGIRAHFFLCVFHFFQNMASFSALFLD